VEKCSSATSADLTIRESRGVPLQRIYSENAMYEMQDARARLLVKFAGRVITSAKSLYPSVTLRKDSMYSASSTDTVRDQCSKN